MNSDTSFFIKPKLIKENNQTKGTKLQGLARIHSFFEDNENNFYEYAKTIGKLDSFIELEEKGFKLKNLKREKGTIHPNFLENLENKTKFSDHNVDRLHLANKLKDDIFFFRRNSPRPDENTINQKSQAIKDIRILNDKQELIENKFEDDLITKKVKEKKDLLLYNANELLMGNKNKIEFDNFAKKSSKSLKSSNFTKNQENDEKNQKNEEEEKIIQNKIEIFKKLQDNKAKVMNNVLLLKPQILPTKKQIYYNELTLKEETENYINMLNKANKKIFKRHYDENELAYKLKNFEKFIRDLKIRKNNEKIEKGLNLAKTIKEEENEEEQDLNNSNFFKKNENKSVMFGRKKTRLMTKGLKESCCEKFVNWFMGSPYTSFAREKRNWAGANGVYDKKFQDKRIFNKKMKEN